jgi:branched-subunit amino acid transport protein
MVLAAGMGIVTYLPRWLPVFFLSQRRLPQWFVEWLDLIPVAILSALVFGELFLAAEPRHLTLVNVKSLAAVPTLLFALRTKSLGGTVIFGMFLTWLTQLLDLR